MLAVINKRACECERNEPSQSCPLERDWHFREAGRTEPKGEREANPAPETIQQPPAQRNLLWTTDSVTDRCTNPDDVAGAEEIAVVQDVIVVRFGTHEDVSPDVVADAASDVDQKVIALL